MKMEHIGYGVGQVDLPEGPRVQVPLAGKQEEFSVGMPLVAELESILADQQKLFGVIKTELTALRDKYGEGVVSLASAVKTKLRERVH